VALSPCEIARRLHAALEAGKHDDELRPLFTDDAVTTEHPNLLKPTGATADLSQMLEASKRGAGLLEKQSFEVLWATDVGNTAILRLKWSATIARTVGSFRRGQVLTAFVAQFVETRDDRIASIETFDCYEPVS
jgi:ketosteroid isomerase-like protein